MLTCSSDRPHAIAATTLEHGGRRVLHGAQQRVVLRLLRLELPSYALERRLLRLAEDERLVLFFAGRQVRRVRATAAEALVPLAREEVRVSVLAVAARLDPVVLEPLGADASPQPPLAPLQN